ncbi:hypothetical protein PQC55_gp110 [Escherichia phage vB_EcoP-CHD5UKE1]|uniref:Uncharacterized protein n=1 Tax=Escherichia phage vB_EcoP-CHD5UKE1 TaxID=2865805 RepID=A0ABX9AJU5_9CAUD|nr:hypothetical protein PQC55_gp110 [Escherichia phage vB_EcoP-CHD5UKE1]QZI80648.1 hypothetical protein CHD5UKE1_152 [Escherichia phage vB_EcoP-CHD5UKE1]
MIITGLIIPYCYRSAPHSYVDNSFNSNDYECNSDICIN